MSWRDGFRAWPSRIRDRWDRTTPEAFANWSAGIQSLLIGGGVLLGAFWTLYLYQVLNEKESAANKLLHSGADLKLLELNLARAQEERGRAFGQVSLTAAPVTSDTSGNCYLQVNATISNAGNRSIEVSFRRDSVFPPLRVASVTVHEDGLAEFSPVALADVYSFNDSGSAVYELLKADLQPGERSTYPFLLKLRSSDLYLIQFSVPIDTVRSDPNIPQRDPTLSWAARTYVAGCSVAPASAAESHREAPG